MTSRLIPRRALSFATGGFQPVTVPYTEVQQAVMPVVGWDGARLVALATAFAIVADGILLTARHVVDDFVAEHADQMDEGEAGLYVLWETDEPSPTDPTMMLGAPLPVVGVSNHPVADLALLTVAVPDARTLPVLLLNVGVPEIGVNCTALGYAHLKFDGAVLPPSQRTSVPVIDAERRLAASRGTVDDVHRTKRDSSRLNFPCFLTDARYDGGMSGGPVALDDGRVVGVVCSAADPGKHGTKWTSYATLLGPALELSVLLEDAGVVLPHKLIDLIKNDRLNIVGEEHLDAEEGRGVFYPEP